MNPVLQLVIGNRNYSSWSLRAWLYLAESGLPFEEIRVPLFTPTWKADIARYSPAARVPVLIDGDLAVWDTLAIFEYLREAHGASVGWPDDLRLRAWARAVSAEMHSGFLAIRDELPQNLRMRRRIDADRLSNGCRDQIARIDALWSQCLQRNAALGPWLFGKFSIADVMYAPVALRFVSYGIELSAAAAEFVAAVRGLDSVAAWIRAAEAETEALEFIDELVPAARSELTLG